MNSIILDTEINNASKLIIEDIEGDMLFRKKLKIDAGGLQESLRNMRDGYTFFGSVKEDVRKLLIFLFIEQTYY